MCFHLLLAAKTQLGSSLANVDWLHGPAESLLTITNLLIGKLPGVECVDAVTFATGEKYEACIEAAARVDILGSPASCIVNDRLCSNLNACCFLCSLGTAARHSRS